MTIALKGNKNSIVSGEGLHVIADYTFEVCFILYYITLYYINLYYI